MAAVAAAARRGTGARAHEAAAEHEQCLRGAEKSGWSWITAGGLVVPCRDAKGGRMVAKGHSH